jgi:hypothetical protein
MKKMPLALVPLVLLGACNPSASEIESGLVMRGMEPAQATCMAGQLAGRLDERDWNMLAELAGDTMRTREEWEDMTVGDITDKLTRLGDTQLMGTLLRAGMGCAILEGGLGGPLPREDRLGEHFLDGTAAEL